MNKLKIIAVSIAVVTLSLILAPVPGLSHAVHADAFRHTAPTPKYSVDDIKGRLNNLSTVIDIEYTHEVGRRIREYTVDYRVSGEKILGKADVYFPIFEQEIARKGLPDELKYVAFVESHLNPKAMSKSGAAGLWQFMKSTAKMQGLVINDMIDERKDPVKPTAAALDYLEYLHEKFGDWTLAIAAYNCGPGNVRKAIRRGGSKDYWTIRRYMPRETQKYVPRIIAAMYLKKYYQEHNLSPRAVDANLMNTININDGQKHSFKTLANKLNVEEELIRLLNPQYKRSYFPSNGGHLNLVIPSSKYEDYLRSYSPIAYKNLLEKRQEKKVAAAKEDQERREAQMKMYKRNNINPVNRIRGLVVRELYSEEVQTVNISL